MLSRLLCNLLIKFGRLLFGLQNNKRVSNGYLLCYLCSIKSVTKGYWVVVQEFTHETTVKDVKRLQLVTTNLGRGLCKLKADYPQHLSVAEIVWPTISNWLRTAVCRQIADRPLDFRSAKCYRLHRLNEAQNILCLVAHV